MLQLLGKIPSAITMLCDACPSRLAQLLSDLYMYKFLLIFLTSLAPHNIGQFEAAETSQNPAKSHTLSCNASFKVNGQASPSDLPSTNAIVKLRTTSLSVISVHVGVMQTCQLVSPATDLLPIEVVQHVRAGMYS